MTEDATIRSFGVDEVLRNAAHYIHDVSASLQATLCPMTAETYRASVFLDHRIVLPQGATVGHTPFAAFCGQFPALAETETGYMFHISHVGSTLLSRLLSCKPSVLALREPALLRWMTIFKELADSPECPIDAATYHAYLDASLGLLARPLIAEGVKADRVVIKPTSFHNILASDILTLQPKARAIAIFCRLDAFTANILKGGDALNDILTHGSRRLKRLHHMLGAQPWRLAALSPGEIAAMSWLTEMTTLMRAATPAGSRFGWLDFDAYLADPASHFAALCNHLNLAWTEQDSAAVERSGLRQKYSKNAALPYASGNRAAQMAEARARHGEEFAKGRRWLEKAMTAHPDLGGLARMC